MFRSTRVRRIIPLSHQTSGPIASTTTEKQRKHDFYLMAKKFLMSFINILVFFFNYDKKYEVSASSSEQKSCL